MKEALFYKSYSNYAECLLCPHNCKIYENKYGLCLARYFENSKLYAKNYGCVSAIAIDPIEKKPLYHFYPQGQILSIGSYGCNFKCQFCQNYDISQNIIYTNKILPSDIVELLNKNNYNNYIGVAYTYNEPLISFEFLLDTMPMIKEYGFKNVIVSNGFINESPLEKLIKFIDAANIDLKTFNEKKYKEICAGKLNTVLNTIKKLFESNIWIEITQLIVPGINDNIEEFKKSVKFIANLSPDIPLHLSRYFPHYKFTNPPTPINTLKKFYEIAKEKLNFVYIGNIISKSESSTYCPNCGKLLIERIGYEIKNNLNKNKCKYCSNVIAGRF